MHPHPSVALGSQPRALLRNSQKGNGAQGFASARLWGQGEGLTMSACPVAMASKWLCINSKPPRCTDLPPPTLFPHLDPSAFAQPHLSLLALPHGCRPTPSLPTVSQASKLSAGLRLQAGRGMKAMPGSSPQR